MISERIITMNVNVTGIDDVVENVLHFIALKTAAYICVSNVHMCMETYDSLAFREVVAEADYVIPDGKPIYWAQKLLGHKSASQVRGEDIMNALCRLSSNSEIRIGLYGGSSDLILNLVKSNLYKTYPQIKIAYSYSPPFVELDPKEKKKILDNIESSEVDILFVGIGCPKQEFWMFEHKDKLTCVMLGVGAAFDFIAGSKKHAPRWLQFIGLEWSYRLALEPRRLWRRYLKHNPRFLLYFVLQLLGKKFL
jgi:N-acetylglucosaminyldiphosphoundecaprenol N-acetyl-beta-D-mannosaminyltransferase